jgi:hypothetical protein
MPPALFTLFFCAVAHIFAHASLDHGPPIYASCLAEMKGVHHYAQLIGLGGVSLLLSPRASLKPQSS